MILVIVEKEINEVTGREQLVVSHGVDEVSGKVIVMPPVDPREVGAVFCAERHEYVIDDKNQKGLA